MSTKSECNRVAAGAVFLIFGVVGVPVGALLLIFGAGVSLFLTSVVLFVVGGVLLFSLKIIDGLKGILARRKDMKTLGDLENVISDIQKDLSNKTEVSADKAKTETPEAKEMPPKEDPEKDDSK